MGQLTLFHHSAVFLDASDKLGLVNNSLDDYGGSNGSSLINGLLYYYVGPILNMDKDEKVIKVS